MSRAVERKKIERTPIELVTINSDSCSWPHITVPCTATYSAREKDYNTRIMCQELPSHTKKVK